MTQHFSWPQFRQPWTLSLSVVELEPDAAVEIDETLRRVRLDEAPSWTSVRLRFELRTTEKVPDAIDQLSAYVLLSSSRTNTRMPISLTGSASSGFVGESTVSRGFLAGVVDATGQILSSGRVTNVVGESDPWTIVIDPGDAPQRPGAPPFETILCSFSATDAPTQLQVASDSYALMDVSGPKPILYLNRDVAGLEHILYAQRPKLEKRRLRDLFAAQIAQYSLSVLFRDALAQSEVDGEDVTLPDDGLLRQVCDAIAGAVASVEDAEDLVKRLQGASSDRSLVWMEVDNAMSRLTNLSEAVARSTEEVHLA